jgi:phytoene dehydrogenase-like protein
MSVEYAASTRTPQRDSQSQYDVIVIGAGLGGLLSAAQFLRRGQRVLVLERLSHPGGRFTAKTFKGAQVSTGAVHMLPFGTNGELANMLRSLAIPHRIHDSEVFGSFHVRGRQYVTRSMLQLAQVFGPRQFAQTLQLAAAMLLRQPRPDECDLSYREWLDRRISRQSSPELYAFFERICHFSFSIGLDDITYGEVIETMKNMFRYGPPGIVDGGCAALTGALERRVLAAGGEIWLEQDAQEILSDGVVVTGVRVRDRKSGEERDPCAPMVISNIGPAATDRLTSGTGAREDHDALTTAESAEPAAHSRREATGLKVHLLSDDSIIPHKGIMYCLDTQRIAGVVQPSNSDRRLAPPGKHLLITHQLMRSDDVNAEREAARADLRHLFGDAFGTHIEILTMSQYRGEWPVNRARQGEDVIPQTGLSGLYLVGDAVKPSGYLMVEGVAQSVNALLDTLDTLDAPAATDTPEASAPIQPATKHHAPPKPSRHRAFYWLLAPPPPHPGS